MLRRKTLNDLIAKASRPKPAGSIPHVFHRHGPIMTDPSNTVVMDSSGKVGMAISTATEKMTAYGTIAAADAMVTDNDLANHSLLHALRTAISHRLMTEVGVHDSKFATNVCHQIGTDGVYFDALEALRHYGTENQKSMLKEAKRSMRKYGLRHQPNILETMIEAGVRMGMDFDEAGLEWFYSEFHSLYGTDKNPNPPKPEGAPDDKEKEPPKPLYEMPGPIMEKFTPDFNKQSDQWGVIESITRIPMTPWKHAKCRSRHYWKYSEFGVFKYPWRALPSSDYRCFSVKRRQYGGTLLIDMSGSMSIDQTQVDQILNLAPYATIAAYSGGHHENEPLRHTHGRIVILAEDMKKGLAYDARRLLGLKNLVDGPALEWLAKQEGPRIWISDGLVTGVGESQTQTLLDDMVRIMTAGKITRIPTLADLIQQLTN